MNSLIKNSVFLVLLSGFVIISNSQTGKGIVSIETNRDSSVIFLNQKLLGIGKAKVMLEPGSYVIRVKENDNNMKYLTLIVIVAVVGIVAVVPVEGTLWLWRCQFGLACCCCCLLL